jgi:hypothetical protein
MKYFQQEEMEKLDCGRHSIKLENKFKLNSCKKKLRLLKIKKVKELQVNLDI